MPKSTIYYFIGNNVRSSTGEYPSDLGSRLPPNCFLNPDLSQVCGVKREHWKIHEGKIIAMTEEEKKERDKILKEESASVNISEEEKIILNALDSISKPKEPEISAEEHFKMSTKIIFITVALSLLAGIFTLITKMGVLN